MKLIQDLGIKSLGIYNRRVGIYECPICKKHYEVQFASVKSGNTTKCRNCACKIRSITHGLRKHRLYSIWAGMKTRVLNANNHTYKNYGGKGVFMCDEWLNNFQSFYDWAMDNGYDEKLSIDRINVNGNYEPSNCRWATHEVQTRNTRTLRANNTSGFRGVCFSKEQNKFVSAIRVDKKSIHLGYFGTAAEASCAYNKYVIDNKLEHTIN